VSWVACYDHQRLNEAIGDVPPAEHEARYNAASETAA
jgi:hypothetical protein